MNRRTTLAVAASLLAGCATNPGLQNGMAYFGSDVTEVSVRTSVADGDRLARALESFRVADAEQTDDGFWVYQFDGIRFVAYVVRYE